MEECIVCDGEAGLMGALGKLLWFRCIHCGIEFSRMAEEGETVEFAEEECYVS